MPVTPHARWDRIGKVAATVLSACVLAATLTGYTVLHHYLGQLTRINVFALDRNRPGEAAHGSENFLLVGSDSRQGLTRKLIDKYHLGNDVLGARSDTMIILHVSPRHDRALLVSLPRDSYVEIPAFTDAQGHHYPPHHGKLNSAYSEGGAALSVETIEHATGVRIDHYVEINVLGFARMVDALGGVPVCLTKAVDDKDSGLRLSAGRHVVNGTEGLAFVRARHALGDGSDLGRIKRQQQFLGAMMRQALSSGTLLDPVKLNAFLDAALKSVQVDSGLSTDDMRTLVMAMRHMDPSHVTFLTVPLADTNYSVPGVGSTVLWDPTLSGQLFAALRTDTQLSASSLKPVKLTVAPDHAPVEVQNGTRTHGLAASVSQALAAEGFRLAAPARNADNPDHVNTVVLYPTGELAAARTVAAAVPGASVQPSAAVSHLTLVLGADYTHVAPVHVGTAVAAGGADAAKKFGTTTAADRTCTQG